MGQTPAGPVFFRRQAELRAQIALEHFQLLAVFEADDVIGGHRLLDWHRRRQFGFRGALSLVQARKGRMDGADHARKIICRHGVVTDIGRNNFSRQTQYLG